MSRPAPLTRDLSGSSASRPPPPRPEWGSSQLSDPDATAIRRDPALLSRSGPAASPSRREEKLAPFQGRMHLSTPTLVGDDPVPAEEITNSTVARRARWVRRGQLVLLLLALSIALWAWLSVPHSRKRDPSGAPPSGSVTVTTDPEDAVLLLDGAQVKDPLDRDWTEPRLTAAVDHVLTVRREGFADQVQQVRLAPGEQKVLRVTLQPLPGQLTVRSTPAGAQVFIDGQKLGITPAWLPGVDPAQPHAVVLEKHCFRPWQVAIAPHAGRREVVATLEAAPGACAGQRQAVEEKPAPEVPSDDPAAMATLGFLSLGSRPSANIFIDGVDIGRTTPILAWPLKVGRHLVKLTVGTKFKEVPVEVLSGQTHSEIIDLRKR